MLTQLEIALSLCILAYIVYSNLKKVRAVRQEANTHSRQQEAKCDTFSQGLTRLDQARAKFFACTSHLTLAEQEARWTPVIETKVRACHFLLAHDFARASAFLTVAANTADNLLAEHQAA
jgi:hypothetical protein